MIDYEARRQAIDFALRLEPEGVDALVAQAEQIRAFLRPDATSDETGPEDPPIVNDLDEVIDMLRGFRKGVEAFWTDLTKN